MRRPGHPLPEATYLGCDAWPKIKLRRGELTMARRLFYLVICISLNEMIFSQWQNNR